MKPRKNQNMYCLPVISLLIFFVVAGPSVISMMPPAVKEYIPATNQSTGQGIAIPTYAAPVVTSAPAGSETGTREYSNSQYGIALSYPATWQLTENPQLSLKDYGRKTLTIATLRGPGMNPATFSIDVDPSSATDLDTYFNRAFLALQNTYPQGWKITKQYTQFRVSDNLAYRLDYSVNHDDTKTDDYSIDIITIARGAPYIFTLKVAGAAYKEQLGNFEAILKSIRITPTAITTGQGS
nr:hypothetical protein [uncultured Methanoregula sp.]